MALQMPVYKEINAVEPKVFKGLSWRQWLAALVMAVLGGGVWLVCSLLLGQEDLGQLLVLVVCIPPAAYGWWRPKGLKPERYLPYLWRYHLGRRQWFYDGPARSSRFSRRATLRER
jgi:hypothetical protein